MIDFRKLIVSIVIAILFTIFVFTLVEAIYPSPQWDDFCDDRGYMAKPNMTSEEWEIQNQVQQACQEQYSDARENHSFVIFLVSVIAGLIATIVGMYIPVNSAIGMSIASGLLLGGLFTLFFGTMSGWDGIGRVVRPIVILIELVVVIWVAYRKLNTPSKKSKSKK